MNLVESVLLVCIILFGYREYYKAYKQDGRTHIKIALAYFLGVFTVCLVLKLKA